VLVLAISFFIPAPSCNGSPTRGHNKFDHLISLQESLTLEENADGQKKKNRNTLAPLLTK
jgi:hypothetical protein